MSGICGAWALDGGSLDLSPVLAKLQRRGPDGTQQWSEGSVSLGHTLLATTPEALVEKLPFTDEESGCVITADVRLDNREELIESLGLGSEQRTIGDGELILRAYLKWSEDCPASLLGDFAFAIWDPRSQRLFCARDHMGMRQLIHYYEPGRLFAFATEAEALTTLKQVPNRINDARIADFLDNLEGADLTSTFFEELYRLPAAHRMSLEAGRLKVERYWHLSAGPELHLIDGQTYADAFLSIFAEAVRCRLRCAGRVGAMLSGGMDSGSVAAVAGRLLQENGDPPLLTFSAVGPEPAACPETRAIQAVLKLDGIEPTTVDHSALAPWLDELWQLTVDSGEPFDQQMTLIRAVYLSAKRRGVRIVLDGAGGDVALTAGNRIAAKLRRGQFRSAWKEARGEERFWRSPHFRYRSLLGGAWVAFVPNVVRRAKRRIASRIADLGLHFGGRIDRDFANRVDLRSRRARFRAHLALYDMPDTDRRVEAINHPHLVVARERYDRVAAAIGIEPRDPFMDIRLIQFCLSLPADEVQRDGWPKYILRRATSDLLPGSFRWRLGKEHLGWDFTERLFSAFGGWRESLEAAHPLVRRYVTVPPPTAETPSPGELERLWDLHGLACWLERNRIS